MSKKKFGHKLGGSFAPLLTHTTKSPAWSMLCVGARALFGHLQGRYYQDREGYVFLSARDGAKELRTHKDNIGRWLDELTHYGFLVLLCGPHLGVDGDGQSAIIASRIAGFTDNPQPETLISGRAKYSVRKSASVATPKRLD